MSSVPHIIFKAFRAIDDLELCQRYLTGHRRVLESVGVKKLTSANEDWPDNPYCYVIVALNAEDGRVLGGTRLQLATEEHPLPIQGAIADKDPKIVPHIASYPPLSVGEMCGMWNSREIAGFGVGSTYVNRIGIALLTHVGISTLMGLAASWTLEMGKRAGFAVAEQFGKNGTFYYPKEDFIATAIIIDDVVNLPNADPEERSLILSLRNQPNQVSIDQTRMGMVKITYELELPVTHLIG